MNRQTIVQIVFTQKLTGAPNVPSAGQYARSSSNDQPKAISKMVKARSTLAAQPVRGIFTVGALVCRPCYPLFPCLLPHCSSGVQAGLVDLLVSVVCARSGLENACKTVRKEILCYSLLMPQVVWYIQTSIKQCMFVCTKFV